MSQSCSWTGRLVRDVDFRYSTKGDNKPFCFLKLAVPRSYRPKDGKDVKVDWLEFKCFGDEAEGLMDGVKGQLIEIHGHVENYTRAKEDGSKEYGHQLIVDRAWNHSKKKAEDETDREE